MLAKWQDPQRVAASAVWTILDLGGMEATVENWPSPADTPLVVDPGT